MARHAKRKQVRRPGLVEAAREFGCTLSHLRRVVIGERASRRLTKRLTAWRARQTAKAKRIRQNGAGTARIGEQEAPSFAPVAERHCELCG